MSWTTIFKNKEIEVTRGEDEDFVCFSLLVPHGRIVHFDESGVAVEVKRGALRWRV